MPTTNGNVNGVNGHAKNAFCTADEFAREDFDYVVIGGGTAGCVVAARLTEDPNIKVGVIEAGPNCIEDENILTPSLYPTLIGNKKYDWVMTSVPQPNAGNKEYSMPRGKLLGGSSGINYLMYVRGSKNDYDGWAYMADDKTWGWEGLVPYFKKHQKLDQTELKSKDVQFMPHAEIEKWHGQNGPIHTSFNDWYMPIEEEFAEAAHAVTGTKKTVQDAWSGDHLGFYSSLGAVDRSDNAGTRSYAATGYIKPNLHRSNLKVLVEAHATKIILDGKTAKGVAFVHNGQTYEALVKKEVILSAGVIQTPQLLELSGIGDPVVLEKAGLHCVVENKGVGANFQDHVLGGILFDLKPGVESMDALHGEEFQKAQQEIYKSTQKGMYGSPGMMMGFVSYSSVASPQKVKETVAEISKNSLAKTDFEKRQQKVKAPNRIFCIDTKRHSGDRRPTHRSNLRQPTNIL